MASVTVDVDVDLDDFDLDDILEELEDRYNRKNYRNAKKTNKEIIDDFIKRMKIECEDTPELNVISVSDKIKYDFLVENFDKISLTDLEKLL